MASGYDEKCEELAEHFLQGVNGSEPIDAAVKDLAQWIQGGGVMQTKERYTPPSWMRHVISWRVLGWLNKHLDTCWAGMVMWKLGYEWGWWPRRACFDPHDYCGKFDDERTKRCC